MQKMRFLIALWLTIAATGVWADTIDSVTVENQTVEVIPDQVKMSDGTVVTARRLPRRAPDEDYTYTYKGVKYTYITGNNYTRFFDTSVHQPWDNTYQYRFDDDGWLRYHGYDGAPYIVAATIDEESVPANGEVFILNDLVGYFKSHTHLACVADHGFSGKSKVKRIYFQDSDAWSYNSNTDFMFFIGHRAFNNAPQLEKIDLMQYITKGTNHWEPMPTNCIPRIWSNMLEGSPNAFIRVATSTLNSYRSSGMWSDLRDRIISYEPSGYEINDYGARYKCLLADDGKTYLTNDGNQRETVLQRLRPWNADYQSFNASSLMAPADNGATVYYTTIEGNDADYLKKNNGVLKVYNDIGSYYNYKTIAIRRGAFANCDDLKAVEFHQTNGRSENSYSDLKVCIENGAFRGCKNLKEIRLYYYVEDGDNHWETLGPEDVIPGDDIFGWKADIAEGKSHVNVDNPELNGERTRIVVSPDRYAEFRNDPNWAPYLAYIVPADYEPSSWSPIATGGLTYDYVSKSVNSISTDQVVTVTTSWWTAAYWAAQIAITALTAGSGSSAPKAVGDASAKISTLEGEKAALETAKTSLRLLGNPVNAVKTINALNKPTLGALFAKYNLKGILGEAAYQELLTELFTYNKISLSSRLIMKVTEGGLIEGTQAITYNAIDYSVFQIALDVAIDFLDNAIAPIAEKILVQQTIRQNILRGVLASKLATFMGSSTFLSSRFLPAYQALDGEIDQDQLKNGIAGNLLANIHQVGMVGLGFTTPDKKMIHQTYIKEAESGKTDFTIYNDVGSAYNYRTVGISRKAFMGNKMVQTIKFAESRGSSFDSYAPLLLTIPDSAFAGCTGLREFDLRYTTAKGGQLGLGPENFVLCGDSIFAGCDSTKLRIIVAEDRLQDFLDNDSWAKYKRFLTTGKTEEKKATSGYGVNYAYAYTNNSTRHITYSRGHEVEHLYAYEADNDFLNKNSGAIGLFNDVGNWNNYHLDYVKQGAFEGNQNLKEVSFWNVNGISIFGESYETIDITLQDKSFANCSNLEQMGLIYLSHSGTMRGSVKPLTPATLRLGDHVFDNTPNLKLKMMPSQMEAFMADSAWASYKDKFLPCLITPVDAAVKSALSDLRYTLHCSTMNNTWDIIDVSLLKEKDYSFYENFNRNEKIRQFPEFKQFELAGLDFVGNAWFVACSNLTTIELPSTIKSIGSYSFQNCDLREIEIPAAVTSIGERAFHNNYNLKSVRCLGTTPAEIGSKVFEVNSWPSEVVTDGFKIYVPAEAVAAYKKKWSDYKDYIVAYEGQKNFPKEVTTTAPGQLAEKLGLETVMDGNYLEGLYGAYWKIDSLTVSGPLNGVDVGVLRFLGGADVNNSDHTAGQLRYLNLYNARLKKDKDHPYQCYGINDFIENDDVVDEYMFYYCKSLETVILPKAATYIGEHVFDHAVNLKHLAVGDKTTGYDDRVTYEIPGLDELVLLTTQKAVSDATKGILWNYDSWDAPTNVVYCRKNLIEEYANEPALTQSSQLIVAAFEDDEALTCFTEKGHFFPSEYRQLKNIDGILNNKVKSFDELGYFMQMTDLGAAFSGCSSLEKVTLPDSLKTIGYSAFQGCSSLKSITVSADSAATLEGGTFRDLPADFCIYVPKTHAKRYREAWAEYADHIVGDDNMGQYGLVEITTTGYGQVAEKLGLSTRRELYENGQTKYVRGILGDYTNIRRLKINGPISGEDFAVLRYLCGYSGWNDARNYAGHLQYLDLYDAQVVKSDAIIAEDRWFATDDKVKEDDVLPPFALRRAYALKTLILPKTLKKIDTRSLMECEYLETVVIGEDVETINWSAFDDDASLTRMYLLAKKKPKMDADNWFWRNMCNNYNPTFDAFYVRPSLYNDYIGDNAYVGNSWQRTNNISTGAFKDDDTFAAFAAHAAATQDDLAGVNDVTGWFANHTGIKDLTPLRYTLVDSLKTEDMQPLTQLQCVAMPMTLVSIGDDAFANAKDLRWVDFMISDSEELMDSLKNGGLRKTGLSEDVLCFLPNKYGQTDEVNVIVGDTTSTMNCAVYRLVDGRDYDVPYNFKAQKVENTRTLTKSAAPYTICLPYDLNIPTGAKAYKMSGRSDNELIFTQTLDKLEALQPYLIWADQSDATLGTSAADIPASGGMTYGRQDDAPGFSMRGTLYGISNAEAAELGAYTLQNDGKWHPVLSDTDEHRAASILPFRAYLLQNRGARNRAIGMTLEDTTGIEQLRTIDSDGTERIYDLNGRQLSAPTKGISIINGKKIIAK